MSKIKITSVDTNHALDVIFKYISDLTEGLEHHYPCDAMEACGECYICESYKNAKKAARILGKTLPK